MKILKTDKYDRFKLLNGNRDIDEAHVRRLKASIKANNLLESNPILITENGEVLDGQHRLTACKELNLPVYYTVSNGGDVDTVITLNTLSKNWSLLDYAKSYAARGDKSYEYIVRLCEEFRVGVSVVIALLSDGLALRDDARKDNTPVLRFKTGKLKYSQSDYLTAQIKARQIFALSDYVKPAKTVLFVKVMLRVLRNPKFDIDRLFEKLHTNDMTIEPRNTVKDYLRDIEDVYNFNVKKKDKLLRLYE